MPKDAAPTDHRLLTKLQAATWPKSFSTLASDLGWTVGKIDGATRRLQALRRLATVKCSPPTGHPQRFVGLPDKPYWKEFHYTMFVENKYTLDDDPLEVLEKYIIEHNQVAQVEIKQLKQKIQELKQQLETKVSTTIDPAILKVIESNLEDIRASAERLGVTPDRLLESGLPIIANPDLPVVNNIANTVMDFIDRDSEDAIEILRRATT
jgi:hypothetical protein